MKVSCPACDSKYTIADEKVAGRKVKVRCKSCGGQILINGTIPPPAPDEASDKANASTAETESSRPSATAGMKLGGENRAAVVTSAPDLASSAPPPADDGLVWSVNVTENDERSLSTAEVVEGYLSGEFAGEVYVWHDGLTDWALIPDIPMLAQAIEAAKLKSAPKAAEPVAEAAPGAKQKTLPALIKGGAKTTTDPGGPKKAAARIASAKRPENAHDLFAAASTAGSELDVAVSDEDAAGSPKMTGARNENSVLFSLDALKAGIVSAPTPMAAQKGGTGRKAPAVPRKKLEDLMSNVATPLASGPVATTLLAANQALLTAPAPPPPKPKPEPVPVPEAAVVAAAAGVYASQQKKKGLIMGFLGAVVAVGAIAGIAIAMTRSKTEPAATVAASSKPVPAVTAAAASPESTKPAEPAAAAPAEPASSAAAATPSASAVPGAAAPKAVAAGPKSGGSASSGAVAQAKTEAKTEAKKETKREEPAGPVSSGVAGFNREAASQALSVAASQTSICKKPDGPTGQGKVQVTFAPSGRATTANIVAGPFGGTAVGGCVSGVFKRARVPPFAGDPVTVAKSFSIVP